MPVLLGLLVGLIALASPAGARVATPGPCRAEVFEQSGFVMCTYRARDSEIRLAVRGPAGPIGNLAGLETMLGKDASRVAFAMNAGMYDPDQGEVGLFVAPGQIDNPLNTAEGAGNFYLKPNGVFWVDGAGDAHVEETSAYGAHPALALLATQSGALLVRGGALHPAIAADGVSRTVRNGVGVRDGEALFVISDGPVSFGRLARFFRDRLHCADALYLDGSVSSLWAPSLKRQDRREGLGTFVVVLRRP